MAVLLTGPSQLFKVSLTAKMYDKEVLRVHSDRSLDHSKLIKWDLILIHKFSSPVIVMEIVSSLPTFTISVQVKKSGW